MKKKILIVADTYFPKIDGIMRFLQEVVPRIADAFEITLLVPDFGGSWDYSEIKVRISKIIKLAGYNSMRLSVSNIKKIRDAVNGAHVVFIQGPALISMLSLYFGRRRGKTVIHFVHLIMWEIYKRNLPRLLRWPFAPLLKLLTVYGYNKCNVLAVPYKSLVHELAAAGVNTKKEVIPLGVDPNKFRPPEDKHAAKERIGISQGYIVVGYIGRISKEKNVATLVEAVTRIQEDCRVMLLAVGSGSKHAMGIFSKAKNAMLPGFVNDVTPYYQAMDIFVMPSLTETTSLATLEAMACGVPVITTKVGFLKEYVVKDYNGLLFPRGNVTTLVLQLRKLIQKRRLRMQMGINARATALKFSWSNTASRIKKILERY